MQIKFYKIILVICIFFQLLSAHYYYNDFSTTLGSEWSNNIRYGQSGLFTNDINLDEDSVIGITNNRLRFSGSPHISAINVSAWEFNGTWVGNGIMLTNEYSATMDQPFGFDIKRVNAAYATRSGMEDRNQVENSIWLIQQEKLIAEWQKFVNYFMIFDNAQNTSGTNTRFGIYQGALSLVPLSNVFDQKGNSIDISSNYTGNQSLNSIYSSDYSITNTNYYIFRITHDGNTIRTYINPDPDDNDPNSPNEFCLVAERSVSWQSNMVVYLNHETRCRNSLGIFAEYDYLRIRSVASGSSGILRPGDKRGEYVFQSFIRFDKNDSGFNTLSMEFPKNPQLKMMPLIKIEGKSVNILNDGKKLDYVLLNNSYKEGEINALCLVKENKITFIFNKFIKNNTTISSSVLFSCSAKWDSDSQLTTYIDGKQYDQLKWSHGNGATTGRQKINGRYSLSDLSVVIND